MPLFCLCFYSSPLNLLGSVRHSSSSLSSHTSSETGNLVILTDSSVGETAEDMYHMQVQLQHSQERLLETALNVLWRVMRSMLYLYTRWDLSCDIFLKELNSLESNISQERWQSNSARFTLGRNLWYLYSESWYCGPRSYYTIAFRKWDFSQHVTYLTCSTYAVSIALGLWEGEMSPADLSAD